MTVAPSSLSTWKYTAQAALPFLICAIYCLFCWCCGVHPSTTDGEIEDDPTDEGLDLSGLPGRQTRCWRCRRQIRPTDVENHEEERLGRDHTGATIKVARRLNGVPTRVAKTLTAITHLEYPSLLELFLKRWEWTVQKDDYERLCRALVRSTIVAVVSFIGLFFCVVFWPLPRQMIPISLVVAVLLGIGVYYFLSWFYSEEEHPTDSIFRLECCCCWVTRSNRSSNSHAAEAHGPTDGRSEFRDSTAEITIRTEGMRRAQDKTGIKANGFSSKQIVAAPEPEPEPEPEAQTNATKKYRIYVDPGNGAPQREPDFVVFNLSDTQDPNDDIMLLHELKEGIRLEFGIEVRTSDHVPFMLSTYLNGLLVLWQGRELWLGALW
jgi:hypothetical protein